MSIHRRGSGCKSQERFILCFQKRMRGYGSRQLSAAEAFGRAWEQTLEEVPLSDLDQAHLYRQLIEWARSGDLFTGPRERELLEAWRHAVHEL
jgi:hypothetical protein